ncbi:MAG: nicotinamide riboside transporter PnuC [Bacteroidales bacterium]|nr:nicotinamide riboside transporter PnuC [Bacteroidales bacterium]
MNYLHENWFEIVAALLGFVSIYLQIKQHRLYWPVSLVMVIMYIVVYIQAKLFANMLLQCYYAGVSVYGWYYWWRGNPNNKNSSVPASWISKKDLIFYGLFAAGTFIALIYFLNYHTISDVPYLDALTTALSFTATWMLARKKIENWLVWIVADLIYVGLYFYKGLYPTMILFMALCILAVVGYWTWVRDLKLSHEEKKH